MFSLLLNNHLLCRSLYCYCPVLHFNVGPVYVYVLAWYFLVWPVHMKKVTIKADLTLDLNCFWTFCHVRSAFVFENCVPFLPVFGNCQFISSCLPVIRTLPVLHFDFFACIHCSITQPWRHGSFWRWMQKVLVMDHCNFLTKTNMQLQKLKNFMTLNNTVKQRKPLHAIECKNSVVYCLSRSVTFMVITGVATKDLLEIWTV